MSARRQSAEPVELIDIPEARRRLGGISRSATYELVAMRLIDAYRPGGRIRIDAASLRRYLESTRI